MMAMCRAELVIVRMILSMLVFEISRERECLESWKKWLKLKINSHKIQESFLRS